MGGLGVGTLVASHPSSRHADIYVLLRFVGKKSEWICFFANKTTFHFFSVSKRTFMGGFGVGTIVASNPFSWHADIYVLLSLVVKNRGKFFFANKTPFHFFSVSKRTSMGDLGVGTLVASHPSYRHAHIHVLMRFAGKKSRKVFFSLIKKLSTFSLLANGH